MTPQADTELLQAYLDGELTPDQAAALEERLKTDAALAELLVRLARDEAIFREWVGTEGMAEETIRELLRARPSEAAAAPPATPTGTSAAAPHRRPRWIALGLAAAAAAVVLAVLPFFRSEPRTGNEEALACLTGVQGEVWLVTALGQVRPARENEELLPGEEVRTGEGSSQAQIAYPDGTRLELGSDTAVRLEPGRGEAAGGRKRVFLQAGVVEAEVSRQAESDPMVVATPHAVIRGAGTRFSSTASPEATWVGLAEGEVELTRTRDGQSVLVEKDRFAVAARRDEPLVAQPLPPRITEPQAALPPQDGWVQALTFAPDGSTLAVGSSVGTLTLWDRQFGQVRWALPAAHGQRIKTLAFSPDGTILASGGMDKILKFWAPVTGTPGPIAFPKQKRDIDVIAFAPDGSLLATALGYGKGAKGSEQIALWDPRTGKELTRLAGHSELILTLAFSPDGQTLAASFKDGTVKLWRVAGWQERLVFQGHSGEVYALAFAPGGKWLATAGRDRAVRLWDMHTGETRGVLQAHTREVRALAFAPDGRRLASAGNDGLVRLWDLASGTELRGFQGHGKGGVLSLAFAPDGTLLASGGMDRRVLLWGVGGP
jgi:ferric-dicitrate binding protein FerR (iron transport regulator)